MTSRSEVTSQTIDFLLTAVPMYVVPLLLAALGYFAIGATGQSAELLVSVGRNWSAQPITFIFSICLAILYFSILITSAEAARLGLRIEFSRDWQRRVHRILPTGIAVLAAFSWESNIGAIIDPASVWILLYNKITPEALPIIQQSAGSKVISRDVLVPMSGAGSMDAAFKLMSIVIVSSIGLSKLFSSTLPYLRKKIRTVQLTFVLCLTLVASLLLFLLPAVPVARFFGGLLIALLFLCFTSVIATIAVLLMGWRIFPISCLIFVWIMMLSFIGLNDNRAIRTIIASTAHPPQNLESAFLSWIDKRPKDFFLRHPGRPYPVFVVAAEGGGLYAAAQSALFLARLYDRCPALKHHVFAISSVSGGSLGAGLVAALLSHAEVHEQGRDQMACSIEGFSDSQRGSIEERARTFLKLDHLSPVLATTLFPNIVQSLVPISIPQFDRSRAFERSLELSWKQIKASARNNPLIEPFRSLWSTGGTVPYLLLNVTVAETGEQAVISPGAETRWWFPAIVPGREAQEVNKRPSFFFGGYAPKDIDLPFSTAISLSARFPGLTTSGYLSGQPIMYRFLDGGYIDNSGVESASYILERLSKATMTHLPKLEFHLIIIGGTSPLQSSSLPSSATFEVATTLQAFMAARTGRAANAIEAAKQKYLARQVALPWKYVSPPLGWNLDVTTIDSISASIGSAERCISSQAANAVRAQVGETLRRKRVDGVGPYFELFNIVLQNSCVACEIISLAGGKCPT